MSRPKANTAQLQEQGACNKHRRHPLQCQGDQGASDCRALQDLFFIRPLLSRVGDGADFPNTEKQTQRVRQNEETEEYDPNETIGQNHSKSASWPRDETMPHREFKVMVRKIPNGFEKRVEDTSQSSNKEGEHRKKKNKPSEIRTQ